MANAVKSEVKVYKVTAIIKDSYTPAWGETPMDVDEIISDLVNGDLTGGLELSDISLEEVK